MMQQDNQNTQEHASSSAFRGVKGGLKIAFLVFLVVGTVFILRKQQSMPYQHFSGQVFGTIYNITYQSDQNLEQDILDQLEKVDMTFSTFKPQSIVSRINRNENVATNQMFNEVFDLSEDVSRESDGAFDITVAPLVNVWGFGFKTGENPTPQVIDSLKSFVGFHKVHLIKNIVKKDDPRTMLDCSAVAKGYGSDAVAQVLRAKGVQNFMVEIGGEIVVSGNNEHKEPWKIGVTKPTDDSTQTSGELQTVLKMTDIGMATSGNYRKFYYKNGRKYAHTIDPKTGYPVQHNILSATVLAKTCAKADAYATAFMVLGLEKTQQVLERHPELMAYLIYTDEQGHHQIWYSKALKQKLTP